jgi:hypothetical protein
VVLLAGVFGLDGGENFGVGLFNQVVAVVHGSPLDGGDLDPNRRFIDKGCPGERLKTWSAMQDERSGCALPSGSAVNRVTTLHVRVPCFTVKTGSYRQLRTPGV